MSNPVPSSLALTSIASNSSIVSADHRTNYSAIQTAVNALITALGGGTSGQTLSAVDSTHVQWTAGNYRKNTTTDIVSATTGDLSAGALTIAANAMGANGIVHVNAWGDLLNNTGTSQSCGMQMNFGASTPGALSVNPASSATRTPWYLDWWIGNQNATNVQQQSGQFRITGSNFAILATAMAIDTTSSVAVTFTAQLGASNALLSMRCHGALVQVFPG